MFQQLLRRKARPAHTRRVSLHAEWLEPRLLYSADAAPLLVPTTDEAAPELRTLTTSYEYGAEATASPTAAEVRAAYALTPMQFEVNAGQLAEGVDFAAFGSGYGIQLSGGQAEISLGGEGDSVRLQLVGARAAEATGENLLAARSNYLLGQDAQNWVTDIANYASVLYRDVYEGIDVRYYGNQGQLEYDFIVGAGADASQLRLRFDGVGHMEISAEGDLLLRVAGSDRMLRFAAPFSYQEGPGGRETVASRYELQADGSVRIVVGDYDRSRELVVDPVLRYGTYYGESADDVPKAVAIGADGSVYVTGYTTSLTNTLANKIGANAGGVDMFIAKFSADLGTLIYSTRIGGNLADYGNAIAVDASGNAVVAGTAQSSFPIQATTGYVIDQAVLSGTRDAVLVKLNAAGNGLVFSTYVGGTGNNDAGTGVAIGADGRIFVAGTYANGTNEDAFLSVYQANGMLEWMRTAGGSNSDSGAGVAVDAAGNAYLVGALASDLPFTVTGADQTRNGPEGFLVKYNASGTVTWSTYIGGTNGDAATGVAVDGNGRAYVVGTINSPETGSISGTTGALSATGAKNNTGFLGIYNTNVTGAASLEYLTFIGGTDKEDSPTGVALIGGTRAVVVGTTASTNLPTTTDAVRRTNSGTSGFVMVIDPALAGSAQLAYGSYFAAGAAMGGVAVSGNTLYFTGSTTEASLFTGGYRTSSSGGDEGFIAAIGGFSYNVAPTLVATADLPAIAEDSAAGSGALVSSLATISDADVGALAGIAIVAADSSHGTWQYSLDGTNWTTFTTPSAGNALLLAGDASTRVRFVAAADYNGSASISFHAWDRTTGTAGTVRALGITGGQSAFSSGTGTSTVTVTPVNDLPTTAAASATGSEDAAAIAITLTGSDLEDGGIAGVRLASLPANGLLYTDASLQTLAAVGFVYPGSSVTLYFVPAADFHGTTTFSFKSVDSQGGEAAAPATATLTVTPANDAPVLSGANDLPAQVEDAAADGGVLVSALLTGPLSDVDAGALAGIAVTAVGAGGTWQYSLDGTNWTTITTPASGNALLLAADANTRVRFVASADFAGASGITFHAWDRSAGTAGTVATLASTGGTSAFSSATATATVTVSPVQDAPVLAGANDLPAQLEDAAAGPGVLVSALVTGQLGDPDAGALGGIAVTAVDSSKGSWQYSLNGSTWIALNTPASGSALLLAADGTTRVRFLPNANYAGTSSISFHGWDRTAGTAGSVAALGTPGGGSAFSATAATASVTVTGVNDAPFFTGVLLPSLTVTEGATVSLGLGTLNYAPGGGADEASQAFSVRITALPEGVGTIQLADGTAVVAGNTYTLAELQAMRILGGTRTTGFGTFAFTVFDSGGTANGGQDSALAQSMTIVVTNTAPLLTSLTGNTFTQMEDIPGTGTQVADIIAGHVSDPGGAWGIVVVGLPNATTANGAWQYSLDGGSTWQAMAVSNNSQLLLGPTARVRFVGDAGENIAGNVLGFDFRAWDGSAGVSGGVVNISSTGGSTPFSLTVAEAALYITPVNDIPVRFDVAQLKELPAPANVTVNEGAAFNSLGLGYLEYIAGYSEEEYYSQNLTYTVTTVPAAGIGTIYLADNTTVVTAGTSYTLAQLQGMKFKAAAGLQGGSATFGWKVQDDAGTDNGGVDTLLESITITVRNVAPTLTGANAMPAITEDAPTTGMRVSELIANKASDPNNILGIAVTGAAAVNGTWQYTSDGGTTWNSLAGASATSAILLETGGQWRVRFNPAANWNGTSPGLSFRAWDRSVGSGGGTADTTVNGGTSAFSSGTATVTVSVGAVNDAPARSDAVGVPLAPLIILDGAPITSLGLAGVTFGPGGGGDEANQRITSYTITALPSGLGTTYLANGTTAVVLGATYSLAEIQGMQFKSSGIGALGTQAFSFAVKDNGGTANGGTDTATFTVNVIVNRAPVLNGANDVLSVFEDFVWTGPTPGSGAPPWASPSQRSGVTVGDIIGGQIVDTTGSEGGIAVVGTLGNGTWQFSLDGTTWATFPAVSNSGALQLPASARVRFLPGPDWNGNIGSTGLTFRAWDLTTGSAGTLGDATWNGGPFAFSASVATSYVTVTPRNDAPIAVGATGGTVEEGAAPAAMLAGGSYAPGPATATDEAAQVLTFRFTAISSQVELLLADGSTPVTVGAAYTLDQFRTMLFRSAANAIPGQATVSFQVQDSGGIADGGADTANLSLTLTITNRAPVLDGANPLADMQEDTPDSGTLVADLIAGQVVDPSGTRGIAVTGLDNSNGSWQYTRDGGATWTSFGTPGTDSARLLLADALTRVRFLPATDWSGTATFSFAAWDGTAGVAGGVGNATVGGSGTAFSINRATSSINVLPVNDAPVGGPVSNLTVAEDSGSTSLGLGAVSYGQGGGSFEAGQALTFTVAALPPATFGRITLADGTDVGFGEYTLEQIRGMRFVTAANAVGSASFRFDVRDNGGGATDTLSQAITITITPVNDPPLAGADAVAGTEDQPLTILPGALTGNDSDVDGDPLAVVGVSNGTGGTVALVDGNIVFTPTANFTGAATFGYTVSDGQGGFASATVTVTLVDANDAPVAAADSVTATSDTPLVLAPATLLANDTDLEGDALAVVGVGAAVNGTVELVDGNVVFTAAGGFTGAASFSYTVSDGRGGESTATVSVTVIDGNRAPVAAADGKTTPEQAPLVFDVADLLANDSDPNGDALTVTAVTAVTGGSVALDGTTITFTPAPDFNGTARFTYSVSDGRGGLATGTVDVTVTPVNDPPLANDDSVAGTEDQPLTIAPATLLGNDSDIENDTLVVESVASVSGGTVALVDGSIVFTPAANFSGEAVFTYTVHDGNGGRSNGTVRVAVAPVNDAPAAAGDTVAATEDETLVILPGTLLGNDSDPDGNPLAITAVGDASGGTVALVDGNIVFTPTANFNGAGSFTYTVSDGQGGTSTATVRVDIAAANDDPVAGGESFETDEDTPLVIAPAALLANDTDLDGDSLVLQDVAAVAGGTVAISGGNVVFTPAANFNGEARFTYTVSDGQGGTAIGTVVVTVRALNDAPVLGADTVDGTEDTPLVISPATLLANDSDADGDVLAIVGLANGSGGTVAFSGEDIVFTPTADFNGSGSFSYTVSDGQGGLTTRTVVVAIAAVNDAPLAHADLLSASEDTPVTMDPATLLANDEDTEAGPLDIVSVQNAAGGTVALVDGSIVFTPDAEFTGAATFTYTIRDAEGAMSTATVTLIVGAVNDAPVAEDDEAETLEDTPLTFTPGTLLGNDHDPENDGLGIVDVVSGVGGQVNVVDGNIVFTPDADFNGTAMFFYTVSDGNGGTATAMVIVAVTAVNDAPRLADDVIEATEDVPLAIDAATLLANDLDVEGSPLTLTEVSAVSGGTVSLAGGTISFTPAANFNGVAVFTYTVRDEDGATTTGTVTVNLAPVDDAPVAAADAVAAIEDQPLRIAPALLLANDSEVDGEALTVSVADGSNGTVALVDGEIVFTPAADFHGEASFWYTVTDPQGGSSTALVTVTVAAVNDLPVGRGEVLAGTEDEALVIPVADLLVNDSDVDGDTLAITDVSGASGGTATLGADGNIVFTPAANHNGVASFSYTISDGKGGTATATVTINLAAVDDPTVMQPETVATDEDVPVGGNVLANDSDVETAVLQVASFTVGGNSYAAGTSVTVTGGEFTLAADGSWTFTPAADWNGAVPVVGYTTNTGASSTLAITVNAVDDATVVTADTATVDEDTAASGNVLTNDSDVDSTLAVASFRIGTTTYTAGTTVALAAGAFTLGADGAWTFTPAADWNGTVPAVTYTTNTGASSTLAITVDAVDDATVATADSATVDEDTAASGNVLTNDVDVDSTLQVASFKIGSTTYAAGTTVSIADVGSFTLGADGAYNFTPLEHWNGTVPVVTYTTNTGAGSTLALAVDAVDDPTEVAADEAGVAEDTVASGNVLDNDYDVEGGLQVASFSIGTSTYAAGSTVTIAGVGDFSLADDGAWSFSPAAHWNGAVPVVTYTTNTGASSTLAITVDAVDDATVVAADTASTNEDTAASGSVFTNDSDVDSTLAVASFRIGTTTYTAGTSVTLGAGEFTLGANGAWSFTPAADWNGTVPVVSYTTVTGATSTLTITVDPVDDATIVAADSGSADEDSTAAGNVFTNDSDVDSTLAVATFQIGAVTYAAGSAVTIDGTGEFTLSANGDWTFTPATHWNGTVPVVTYTTNTGASTTLTITIAPVDDATVVAADTARTDEDTPATGNVFSNDSDVDSTLAVATFQIGTSTYTAGTTVSLAAGEFTLGTNGAWTFSPAANWNGVVPVVSYTTSTGATSTLAITVDPVDDATVAGADTASANEDEPASGNVLANDSDVDSTLAVATFRIGTATYTAGTTVAIGGAGDFTLGADGAWTFSPAANWNGTVPAVSYTTNTGATSTLAITVDAVDDATSVDTDTAATGEDTPVAGNVLANDSDIDSTLAVASFRIGTTSYTAGTTVTLSSGEFTLGADGAWTFTPAANWNGAVPVVTYATNTGASSTLTLTVDAVDDATVLAPDTAGTNEDEPATGNVLTNDSDIDSALAIATFRIGTSTYAAGTTVSIDGAGDFTLAANGAYAFTPAANWNGAVPVVSYTTNTGATSTLTITVDAVDDATTVGADTASTDEDAAASGNVLANDSDIDSTLAVATFQIGTTTYTAGTTVTLAAGDFTLGADGAWAFSPGADWNGTVPVVTYTTSTGASSTLAITVSAVDDASVVTADAATADEDTAASGNVLTNDSDVDSPLAVATFRIGTTTYTADTTVSLGAGEFTLGANGAWTFSPAANWSGTVPVVTYTTSTGASSTLAITIAPVDDATVVTADTGGTDEDTPTAGDVFSNDSDVDSTLAVASFQIGTTTYTAGTTVALGAGEFTLGANGAWTFTPAAHWNGTVPVVTYTTTTGASTTLTITVAPVDDATVAAADTASTDEDVPATGNVLANDSDVDSTLAVAAFRIGTTTYAAGTTVTLGAGAFTLGANGAWTFTPAADWNGGVPVVSYTTSTGATSTLAITVDPVDDASVVGADTASTNEDAPASGNVLANDSDIDSTLAIAAFRIGTTTYTAGTTVALADTGEFTLGADGAWTFTPAADWNGTVPVVSYSTNTGATSTLTITVDAVDDATIVGADTAVTDEDAAASGNVFVNDSDVDSPLQVASFRIGATSYTAGTTVAIAGSGDFTLAADGAWTFTPAANWNGAVPVVSYTTSTGASSTLAITVDPVDDATVVAADTGSADEDSTASGNVFSNDSDIDSTLAVATFRIGTVTHAAGSTVTLDGAGEFTLGANGAWTFTPSANWNGTVPVVTYTTTTGASTTLTITIAPVDDATAVGADTASTDEDTPASGNVFSNDSDIDSTLAVASFQIGTTTYTAGATVTLGAGEFTLGANGAWSFTPAANWNGSVPVVTYTTSTGASSTLTLTVDPVDDATLVAADTASTDEDMSVIGNVLTNDSDIDSTLAVASFRIGTTTYAAGTTVTLASGAFTLAANGAWIFTPAADWNGAVPLVTYTTTTGASSTLAVTIRAVDDATVVGADAAASDEDTPAAGNVFGNDSDVDSPLAVATFRIGTTTYTAGTTVTLGAGDFTLAADGAWTFTPAANWNGTLPVVTYTTSTGASSTLAITVNPVDDAPILRADAATLDEDTVASGNVLANDSDIDSALQVTGFRIGGANYAAGATASIAGVGSFTLAADGAWQFTPLADWNGGVPTVSYTVAGGTGTLDLQVAPVNDAPGRLTLPPAELRVAEGSGATPLGLGALAYSTGGGADEAAQALVYTVDELPAGIGRIVLADGVTEVVAGSGYTLEQLRGMQFLAGAVASGTGTFGFTVSDGGAGTLSERLRIEVVNQAPVLAGAETMPTLLEDTADNGMLVADLIAGHASDPLGRHGIAVVSARSSGGQWQLSRDGGATWQDLSDVSATDAELLPADALARVRFVPGADWNGEAGGLVFRAWDQSNGTGSKRADTSVNGGSSAFSSALANTTLTVKAVNDAPIASGNGLVTDPAAPLSIVNVNPGGGSDESSQQVTVTFTSLPPSTVLDLRLADGVTPVRAGVAYTLEQFREMVAVAAPGAGEVLAEITWLVRDDGGTGDGGSDATGGSTVLRIAAAPAPAPEPLPLEPEPPQQQAPAPAPAPAAPATAAAPQPAAAPATATMGAARATVDEMLAAPAGDALIATPASASLMEEPEGAGTPRKPVIVAGEGTLTAVAQRELREFGLSAPMIDFAVTGFAGVDGTTVRVTLEQFQQVLRQGAFIDQLNQLRRELEEDFDLDRSTSVAIAGLSLGASVAYVMWMVRGGVLLGSYLSALPAWRLLDPLPVLARMAIDEDEEEEALDPDKDRGVDPLRGFA